MAPNDYTNIALQALQGTLGSSTAGTNPTTISIENATDIGLLLYWLSPTCTQCGFSESGKVGEGLPGYPLAPHASRAIKNVPDDTYFLLLAADSGAFAAVVAKSSATNPNGSYVVDCGSFLPPGTIGPVPKPTKNRPIPVDSPRVLVGCGQWRPDRLLAREQFWHLTVDSFTLSPNETATISVTQTSGVQTTSSEQQTVSESLNLGVSAGWGPVSASVSASLSKSSSTFQQVTVTDQTTAFRSVERKNTDTRPATIFVWQLIEIVTVFVPGGPALASIVIDAQPVIMDGPYGPPGELAETAVPVRSASEVLDAAPRLLLPAPSSSETSDSR